jgi:hypothetical protein
MTKLPVTPRVTRHLKVRRSAFRSSDKGTTVELKPRVGQTAYNVLKVQWTED